MMAQDSPTPPKHLSAIEYDPDDEKGHEKAATAGHDHHDTASHDNAKNTEPGKLSKPKSARKRTPTPKISSGSSSSDVPGPNESWLERRLRLRKAKQQRSEGSVKRRQPPTNEQQRLNIHKANYGATGNPVDANESASATLSCMSMTLWSERFFSIMLFLFLLVLGMTLVICSCIKSDKLEREISPKVVNSYAIVLIVIFFIWIICDKVKNYKLDTVKTRDEESGVLIPSHLLNGLVLFGVGSSVCQMIVILDFVKCRRYVSGLDDSCLVYPFFEMAFMFSQIYVFYSLSKDRERKILFGNAFTMFTLAVNLTIWAIYFFAGAVSSKQLEKEHSWLTHYYYGIPGNDSCSTIPGVNSRKSHAFHTQLMPFMYTLAMEYSLLASALLLHLWFGITRQNAGEYSAVKITWHIWRVGFILGLLTLPLLGTMAVNATTDESKSKIFVVYVGEGVLFFLLCWCAVCGLQFVKRDTFRDHGGPMKVDIILLCLSWCGFLVFDLFTIFAASVEVLKAFKTRTFFLGLISLLELITTGLLTAFLKTSYARKLQNALSADQLRTTKKLRQIGSFCAIVSFGFWAMRTYTLRSSYTFDFVSEEYYGSFPWFVVTQLSVPFCTFYHFHSAVCFTEVIAASTPI